MRIIIGERLRKLRKENKVKQEELANIIGVQKSAVSLYERNRNSPSDKHKVEIARYFDVSLDYLLGFIDEQVPCYNEKQFMRLPDDLTDEDRMLMKNYLEFILFSNKRNASE